MRGSISLFDEPCEVAHSSDFPELDRNEAKFVTQACENPLRSKIVTCKDPYRQEFVDEVGGLELDTTLHSNIKNLPQYIPVIDYGSRNIVLSELDYPVVGVTLRDMLRTGTKLKAGMYHEDTITFREHFLQSPAFRQKKIILFLSGTDTLIEWIWYNREQCNLFGFLKEIGVWAVTGFNFSVIGGECPFSQALNQKRSLFSSYLSEQAGLQAIPHVYSLNEYHLNRWNDWFESNPEVTLFTINCQLQKSNSDLNQIIVTVHNLLSQHPELNVLLHGFPSNKVHSLHQFADRIHFAESSPIKSAQSFKELTFMEADEYDVYQHSKRQDVNKLSVTNIIARQQYLKYLIAGKH